MSGYTNKRRVQIVIDFLARGAKYVSKEELVNKEVSPESLRDHMKDSMELETGYLHPEFVSNLNPVSKKTHLDYIKCFIEELELMEEYFPHREKVRRKVFGTLKHAIIKGKRQLRGPAQAYKVQLHVQGKEKAIPVEYIGKFLNGGVIARLVGEMHVDILLNKANTLRIRDCLITYIACHSVRRAKELITFNIKEALTSKYIEVSTSELLSCDVFVYDLFDHKTGKHEEACVILPPKVAEALDLYIRYVRPKFTREGCTSTCPVFRSSVLP